MSPVGSGWWINSRTGESIEVFEHASAIKKEPERFGYTPAQIQKYRLSDHEDRIALLKDVLLKGWIRVRFTRGGYGHGSLHIGKVIELWSYTNRARDALDAWLTDIRAWDSEMVEVHEIRPPGKSWVKKVKDIKYSYEKVESQQYPPVEDDPAIGWQATFYGVDAPYGEELTVLLEKEIEASPNYYSRFWWPDGASVIWECINASPTSGIPTTNKWENDSHEHEVIRSLVEVIGDMPDLLTDLPRVQRLSEASLGRVYQYWLGAGFGIVSADRKKMTPGDKETARDELKAAIRGAGYGYVPVEGRWIETEEGAPVPVTELSYLVPSRDDPEELRTKLVEWGTLNSADPQEAVTYVAPGGSPVEFIVPATGEIKFTLDKFHPKKVGEIYSRLKRREAGKEYAPWKRKGPESTGAEYSPRKGGRPPQRVTKPSRETFFTFESFEFARPPGCWSEALARRRQGEIMFIRLARRK